MVVWEGKGACEWAGGCGCVWIWRGPGVGRGKGVIDSVDRERQTLKPKGGRAESLVKHH